MKTREETKSDVGQVHKKDYKPENKRADTAQQKRSSQDSAAPASKAKEGESQKVEIPSKYEDKLN